MSYIGRQLNLPASTIQLTAEGAITAGKPCIIEADGDVAQVAEAAVNPQQKAQPQSFESGGIGSFTASVYDSRC